MSASSLDDLMGNALTEPIQDMSEDIDIDLEIIDDRPEEDQVAVRAESDPDDGEEDSGEIQEYSGRAGKRINKLKYEFHEERRRKESAEKLREEAVRYAKHMHVQNEQLKGVLQQGESVLTDQMRVAAQAELEKARGDYKSAYEDGNTDALLMAQENLMRGQRSAEMAAQAAQGGIVPQHLREPTAPPPQQQDPKLVDWMGRNEWFGKDQEMTAFAYGVHTNLVNNGITPTTDKYYEDIDNRVKEVFPNKFENGTAREEPVASSRTSTVVAPAGRASNRPRKVQLTSTQVSLAKRLGLKPEQYAKQLLKENG